MIVIDSGVQWSYSYIIILCTIKCLITNFWKFNLLNPYKPFFSRRFKTTDIPSCVLKGAPDFSNVYVISKGKIQSMRSASRPAPPFSPLRYQLLNQTSSIKSDTSEPQANRDSTSKGLTLCFSTISFPTFLLI